MTEIIITSEPLSETTNKRLGSSKRVRLAFQKYFPEIEWSNAKSGGILTSPNRMVVELNGEPVDSVFLDRSANPRSYRKFARTLVEMVNEYGWVATDADGSQIESLGRPIKKKASVKKTTDQTVAPAKKVRVVPSLLDQVFVTADPLIDSHGHLGTPKQVRQAVQKHFPTSCWITENMGGCYTPDWKIVIELRGAPVDRLSLSASNLKSRVRAKFMRTIMSMVADNGWIVIDENGSTIESQQNAVKKKASAVKSKRVVKTSRKVATRGTAVKKVSSRKSASK